jgi:HK97 family phage portal protein
MGFWDVFRRQVRSEEIGRAKDTTFTAARAFMTGGVDNVTSKELAMKIATVFRCIDITSKGIAQLPLRIEHDEGGYFQAINDDPFDLHYLLTRRPNSRLNAFDFKRAILVELLTQGNAYVLPRFGGNGYRELIHLTPGSVLYDKYTNKYTVNDLTNNISGVFEADEIIHFKNLSLDGGYTGVSTLQYASRTMAISTNADLANVETFKSGGIVSGFVSGKGGTVGFGAIQEKQLQSVADDIEAQIASGKKIFNLPGEMSFNEISLSPADIELLSTKQFNVLDICRFFGVHPDKVFAQQSSNYKASEMSQVAFLTDTLQPILTLVEMELQVKLIPRELDSMYRINFDIEPLLQTDLLTHADYMTKTIASGVKDVNYWRKKSGQAPVENGNKVLVSANLKTLDGLVNENLPTKTGVSE